MRTILLAAALLLSSGCLKALAIVGGAANGALNVPRGATSAFCSESMGYPQGRVCGATYSDCDSLRMEYVTSGHPMYVCSVTDIQ